MCGFFDKSGLLRYRRATTPKFRDIRDRSTWELLDTLYYQIKNPPPGQVIDFFTNETSVDGDYVVWVLRAGPENQDTGEVEYFVPGRPLIKITYITYTLNKGNVLGKVAVREDMRLVYGDNEQILVANSLYFQDINVGSGITTTDQSVFSVSAATGTWTGATNLFIRYAPDGGLRTVQILRALN
jgi:hypothetical protein